MMPPGIKGHWQQTKKSDLDVLGEDIAAPEQIEDNLDRVTVRSPRPA